MITVGLYSGVFDLESIIHFMDEWDKNACITFKHNFDHKLIEKEFGIKIIDRKILSY